MTNPGIYPHQPAFVGSADENILAAALIARIVKFDLSSNPVRVARRHGRIHRMGSPQTEAFITAWFRSRTNS